ncbi:MAG: thioredoxin domain-containing protein, partial [Candidatus Azobacteroides sp.]|nr:thioredoxin domain-containing protein [Candidatus Azobacteroides sp.]
ALLGLLKVKHTGDFSNRYFNEHPHKYNLFGLSKMLSDYGVENAATRITSKEEDIIEIKTPFVAYFGGDFVVVYKVESDKVSFLWRGADHVLLISEFIEAWTGIVLLAELSEKSIEPDYKEHKKSEQLSFLKKAALLSTCCLILLLVYISQSCYTSHGISILLLLNFVGVYISYLLLLKQMHIQSQYADKICSLFKQSDCNHVLESKAAKLWGIFGWSEIGLGYFSANVLFLLFLPKAIFLLALLNILTLPYSFWSVWYQKVKARQWCVLCLIIQVLLWTLFIANCFFGYIRMPVFGLQELFYLIIIGSCYLASVLIINVLVPKFNANKMVTILRQAINNMKADESVFKAILKQQPFYETSDSDSIIRFGNPDSSLRLTILSNPYCNPCSRMHKRIETLLQKMNNKICVQYILSSFAKSMNATNKYLIAICLENKDNVAKIFTEWFEKGRELKDDYFKDMNIDMENPAIETEFQKHEVWRNKTQLRATPTVLVNGYQLPENYKIEDLWYFIDFNIET